MGRRCSPAWLHQASRSTQPAITTEITKHELLPERSRCLRRPDSPHTHTELQHTQTERDLARPGAVISAINSLASDELKIRLGAVTQANWRGIAEIVTPTFTGATSRGSVDATADPWHGGGSVPRGRSGFHDPTVVL